MKLNIRHILILCLILLLSVGFGFGYDAIATSVERRSHPQPAAYSESISQVAAEFAVPEAIIWATVRNCSDFQSNAVSGEALGLMQLTPARMESVCKTVLHTEPPEPGLLYDPATNLRLGTAYLSHLYRKYGMWEPVYAAFYAGEELTDRWVADPDCLNGQGRLTKIPDRSTAAFVSRMKKAAEMYTELYY